MQKQTFCANNKNFFPDIGDVFAPFPMFATNIFLAYVGWEILNNLYFLILSIDLGLGYSVMMLFSIDSLKQTSFHAGWIDRKSEICTVYYSNRLLTFLICKSLTSTTTQMSFSPDFLKLLRKKLCKISR